MKKFQPGAGTAAISKQNIISKICLKQQVPGSNRVPVVCRDMVY